MQCISLRMNNVERSHKSRFSLNIPHYLTNSLKYDYLARLLVSHWLTCAVSKMDIYG